MNYPVYNYGRNHSTIYISENVTGKPEKSGRYGDSLWVRRSEIRIPEGRGVFFSSPQPSRQANGAQPYPYTMDTLILS
jgi:hypothetical protein